MAAEPTPFHLHIPDSAIEDLRGRLAHTRLPDEPPLEPWSTGTSLSYLEHLIRYWHTGFDWRAQERDLNRLQQFTVPLDGWFSGAIGSSFWPGILQRWNSPTRSPATFSNFSTS